MALPANSAAARSELDTARERERSLQTLERYHDAAETLLADDLAREVYCVQGLPIDAVAMPAVLRRIDWAVARRAPFVISTPNVNFLARARADAEFRESVLSSDLCPPDGMPIVWIVRALGAPIAHRVAGSDMFDALKARRSRQPLAVFLFGGNNGVAAAASQSINAKPNGLSCVGSMFPGYGSVEEFSRRRIINEINASHADFLMASLGAEKGQLWLHRNHQALQIPVRAHLGAAINFQASTVRRAPKWVADIGLEWLWRIKEEPYLWKRYVSDGLVLLQVLATHVLPLLLIALFRRLRGERDLRVLQTRSGDTVTLSLMGDATAAHVDKAAASLRSALAAGQPISIDLAHLAAIDARFLGLLLMLRKQMKRRGLALAFTGASRRVAGLFRLHGVKFLLSPEVL
jgi:N-acetylglucosaminyldiphosphoundecaprenol N-acetyl-beta-D-mannosaminyltransferase